MGAGDAVLFGFGTKFFAMADRLNTELRSPSASRGTDTGAPWPGRVLVQICAALLAYTSWVWAGLRPSFHEPALWAGVFVLVLTPFAARSARRAEAGGLETAPVWAFLRDPVVWAGAVLLAILFVQFWNSGRPLVYDSTVARWIASPPPHPAWPWAYDPAEARQMVTWFLPAWGLALAIRSGAISRAGLRDLLVFIALNSAVLSVFGVAMRATGMTDMYGITPLPNRFFASFGYENHAASFFMLTSMVSAGLLFDEMAAESGQYRRRWIMLFSAAVGLNLVGVVLSFSRAGILLASGAVVVAMVYAVVWSRWRLLPAERVKLIATMVGLAALGWFSADLIGGPELANELRSVTGPVVTSPVPDAPRSGIPVLLDRVHLVRSAVLMWRSSPWFGIGGGGFRHEYADHVPREYKYYIAQSGKANVHNDGIQFLAEFGVVGVGAMAVSVGAMAWPVARRRLRYLPLIFLSLVGLVGVMLHGVVDLPFRSPAVLFTWVSVLAVLSVGAGNAGPRGGRSRGGVSGRGDRESVQAVR